jgi:hypothetical protein
MPVCGSPRLAPFIRMLHFASFASGIKDEEAKKTVWLDENAFISVTSKLPRLCELHLENFGFKYCDAGHCDISAYH